MLIYTVHLQILYYNEKLYLLILFNKPELTWTKNKTVVFSLTNINKEKL